MIETNINKSFPISVTLVDDDSSQLVSGQTVVYDVRTLDDQELSPPVSGTLYESSIEGGIYNTELNISTAGTYICYATCSGFLTSSEAILVNEEDIVSVSKYNLPYNVSIIDVTRTTVSGTNSQLARNVPYGKTDYIITLVKRDTDIDWSNPVCSGTSYAHYVSTDSSLPYMMGGAY